MKKKDKKLIEEALLETTELERYRDDLVLDIMDGKETPESALAKYKKKVNQIRDKK